MLQNFTCILQNSRERQNCKNVYRNINRTIKKRRREVSKGRRKQYAFGTAKARVNYTSHTTASKSDTNGIG